MAEITEVQKKNLEKLVDRFVNLFDAVGKAESQGFFIEAIVRIDLILNLALNLMLYFSHKSEDEREATELIEETIGRRYFPEYIPGILVKKGLLLDEHLAKIQKFREFRNKIVHNPFGDVEVLIQRKKFDAENLSELEKELFKEECKKGRELVTDMVNYYLNHYFSGEISGANIEWKNKE